MRVPSAVAFLVLLCAQFATPNTYWQVTHGGWGNGECKLESNNIRITINAFNVDIEEDATITALGSVSWGDATTLEIVGDFQFTPGTALRSFLLWNGSKVLKAKLRDRIAADSAYNATVDRNQPQIVAHDPALIECTGDNTYQFHIYPVNINQSRKIRILYSVPLLATDIGPKFNIKTAFTFGAAHSPVQIPIEIRKSSNAFGNYILTHGDTKKTVQFGVTYELPYADFVSQTTDDWNYFLSSAAISIAPDTSSFNKAYCYTLDSTKAAGNYSVIFSTVPDTLVGILRELALSSYTLETKIVAGEKAYVADLPYKGCFGVYIKSSVPWDRKIYWNVYDKNGNSMATFTQVIKPDTSSPSNALLPLFWGTKYTLSQGAGSLGALFGYVDSRMSLLALEKDTLSAADALQWTDAGVPSLLPQEIIVKASDLPLAPKENIMFEFTSVKVTMKELAKAMKIIMQAGNRVCIDFGQNINAPVKATLIDLSGKIIQRWDRVSVSGHFAHVPLNSGCKGMFIMRVQVGSEIVQKKVIVK